MISLLRSAATWAAHHAVAVVAATVIVAAAAAGGITYAVASHGTPATAASAPTTSPGGGAHVKAGARTGSIRRAAVQKLAALVTADTGQTLAAIETRLQTGATMNQIAGANAAKLQSDVIAAVKTVLDKQVATGRITAAQETTDLTEVQTYVSKAMMEPGTALLKQLQHLGAKSHTGTSSPSAAPTATPAI